jgi:hypothetical protein
VSSITFPPAVLKTGFGERTVTTQAGAASYGAVKPIPVATALVGEMLPTCRELDSCRRNARPAQIPTLCRIPDASDCVCPTADRGFT